MILDPFDVEINDLTAFVARDVVVNALDDDGDGIEDADVFDSVKATCKSFITDIFGLNDIPEEFQQTVRSTYLLAIASMLFNRRGHSGQNNPYETQYERSIDRLRGLVDGSVSTADQDGGAAITDRASTFSAGRMIV